MIRSLEKIKALRDLTQHHTFFICEICGGFDPLNQQLRSYTAEDRDTKGKEYLLNHKLRSKHPSHLFSLS